MSRTPEGRHPLARLVNLPRRPNGNGSRRSNGTGEHDRSSRHSANPRSANGRHVPAVECLTLEDIAEMELNPRLPYVQPTEPISWQEHKVNELRKFCNFNFRTATNIPEAILWHWRIENCHVANFDDYHLRYSVTSIADNLNPTREALDISHEAELIRDLIKSMRRCDDPNKVYISVGSMEFATMTPLAYMIEIRDQWNRVTQSIMHWPPNRFHHTRAVAKIPGTPTRHEGCGLAPGTFIFYRPSTSCGQNGLHNALLRKKDFGGAEYFHPFSLDNLPRLTLQQRIWGKDHHQRMLQHSQLLADMGDRFESHLQEWDTTAKDEYVFWLMLGAMQNERFIVHLSKELIAQDPGLNRRGFFGSRSY